MLWRDRGACLYGARLHARKTYSLEMKLAKPPVINTSRRRRPFRLMPRRNITRKRRNSSAVLLLHNECVGASGQRRRLPQVDFEDTNDSKLQELESK